MKRWAGWLTVAAVAAVAGLTLGGPAAATTPNIVIGADGTTAPVFSYADAIRERVWIPVPGIDQNSDGTDDRVAVDIIRPQETQTTGLKVPAIIDVSPYYSSLGRGNESEFLHSNSATQADGFPLYYDNYFVPRGYAFIAAQAVGTAWSTGCPLHGGPGDVAGFKAVIDWLRGRAVGYNDRTTSDTPVTADWDNGKNAMFGKSYDGTFSNGVAATGVEGLTTIVPISAISDWYDYSRMGGIRFNTHYPASLSNTITQNVGTTQLGVAPPSNNASCAASRTAMSAVGTNGDGDADGDINDFWQARNYNLNVGNVHASVFVSHGLNDDNVRPNHFSQWWAGLTANNVPRKLWLSQEGHVDPFDYRRTAWVDTVHRWFDYWLYGIDNQIMKDPQVDIETGPNTWTTASSWPLPTAKPVDFYLHGIAPGLQGELGSRSGGQTDSLTFTDANLSENNYLSLTNSQTSKAMFISPPLTHDMRISGTPIVDVYASLSKPQTNLSALLVDYGGGVLRVNRTNGADGVVTGPATAQTCWADAVQCASPCPTTAVPNDRCYREVTEATTTPTQWRVSKGILDSSNRDSLFTGLGSPAVVGQKYEFKWPTLPNDFTFVAGHRIGIVIGANFGGYGSVNGTLQTQVTLDTKLSKVTLPVVDGFSSARDSGAFDAKPVVKIVTPPEGAVYRLDKPVNAIYGCTDDSAVASCVGTVPNGSPIDTSTIGPHTFTVTATDDTGNTATATTHYTVVYTWQGFFSPISNESASELNLVHAGDLVKIGFGLNGDRGLNVLAAGSPTSVPVACPAWTPHSVPAAGAGTAAGLAFGVASGHYTYGWQTDATWAGTCRQFQLRLNDGTAAHTAVFMFFA